MYSLNKKKICAGFDGNSHESFIYKNINGKKYCKACTLKLQPKKNIPKITENRKIRLSLKVDEQKKDRDFYLELWNDKNFYEKSFFMMNYGISDKIPVRKCFNCYQLIIEPLNSNFHHLLPKEKYPDLRYLRDNILILCTECHNSYEQFPDSKPRIVEKTLELKKLLNI